MTDTGRGILVFIALLVIATSVCAVCIGSGPDEPELTPEEQARQDRIKCLSNAQAGIHANLNRQIRANLDDPDSYQHLETQLLPVPGGGDGISAEARQLKVLFSARNAFGGRVQLVATATLRPGNCSYTLNGIE